MAEEQINVKENFITNFIDEDNESGRYDSRVQTRFPPEPNGFLHIGHAKAICLNFSLANKYNGICNLRFDDTNPVKEDTLYVEGIKRDINWLGFQWENLYYASDYFTKLHDYAVQLIKSGDAYVCDLSAQEIREYRGTLTEKGKNSPYRDRTIEENLQLFEQMGNGDFPDGTKTLRAKIDMESPNLNMRDPVMYRILTASHHKAGDAWRIYPMYDYAHPVSDAIEGVTHSVCSLEFEAHRPVYDWFVNKIGFKMPPRQIEFARLNLTGTIMSKRYLKQLVDEKLVSGWDDPRMPTISGIRRRGYTPFSIRDFCDKIGVSKSNSTVDYAMLESCVRDDLGPKSDRVMVVLEPLKLVITNLEEEESLSIENNPQDENTKNREVVLTKEIYIEKEDFRIEANKKFHRLKHGGEVRLKGAYIIKCEDYDVDENGEVTTVYCTYDKDTKSGSCERKVKGTIHWVSAKYGVNATVREYGELMLDIEGSAIERFNKESVKINDGAIIEPSLKTCEKEDRFQFLRQGYYVRDNKEEGLVFNKIVGLRDTFKKKEQ